MKPRLTPFRVLIAGAQWRLFGSRHAADRLLQAMSGEDEQNRMLAGISLIKAGQRSFDLIEERIEAGTASPGVVRLLPDIDSERSRSLLARMARGEPGELTEAARECIDLIERIDSMEGKAQ